MTIKTIYAEIKEGQGGFDEKLNSFLNENYGTASTMSDAVGRIDTGFELTDMGLFGIAIIYVNFPSDIEVNSLNH